MINWLFNHTPLSYLIQSIWRDEAFSYFLSKKNFIEIISLSLKDFTPPLYYLLLNIWIKIFGSSEIALRSLSFIFYWLTIYLMYLILNEILKINLKKSFIYLLFFLINPLLIYYGLEARAYALFGFLSIFSFYLLYKKNKYYLPITSLGLFTHYFMIFVVLVQYLIFKNKKILKAFLFFLPWLILVLINQGFNNPSFWINSFQIKDIFNSLGFVLLGYEKVFSFFDNSFFFFNFILWLIIVLGYLKIKENFKNKKTFYYFFITGVIIPVFIIIISLLIKPIFLPRYLIFSNISLLILLITIFNHSKSLYKLFFGVLLVVLTVYSLNYQSLQIKYRKKTDLKKTYKEIKSLLKKDDLVYVTSELDFFVAQYYINENQVFIYNKTYEEIPQYVGKVLIPENKIVQTLPIYPKKAFIIDSKGNYYISAIY